ncbi:MAG: hypothetical protein FJX42_06020, partial [Alphaproteobacteria bacterium]|nr:hypothetical protein [Alphaproteobacteria bacterium]
MVFNRSSISSAVVSAAVLLSTAACSSVPDAANPAHWYRSTVDYLSGGDEDKDAARKRGLRSAQRPAAAEPAKPAADAVPKSNEVGQVSNRLSQSSRQGLVGDAGGTRPRYAPAISRQAEDEGVPPSRAQTAYADSPA